MNNSLFLVTNLFDIVSLQDGISLPKPEFSDDGSFRQLLSSIMNDSEDSDLSYFVMKKTAGESLITMDKKTEKNIFDLKIERSIPSNLDKMLFDMEDTENNKIDREILSSLLENLKSLNKLEGLINLKNPEFIPIKDDADSKLLILPVEIDSEILSKSGDVYSIEKFVVPLTNAKTKQDYLIPEFSSIGDISKQNLTETDLTEIINNLINGAETTDLNVTVNGNVNFDELTIDNNLEITVPLENDEISAENINVKLSLFDLIRQLLDKISEVAQDNRESGDIGIQSDFKKVDDSKLKEILNLLIPEEKSEFKISEILSSVVEKLTVDKQEEDSVLLNNNDIIEEDAIVTRNFDQLINDVLKEICDLRVSVVIPEENQNKEYTGILKLQPENLDRLIPELNIVDNISKTEDSDEIDMSWKPANDEFNEIRQSNEISDKIDLKDIPDTKKTDKSYASLEIIEKAENETPEIFISYMVNLKDIENSDIIIIPLIQKDETNPQLLIKFDKDVLQVFGESLATDTDVSREIPQESQNIKAEIFKVSDSDIVRKVSDMETEQLEKILFNDKDKLNINEIIDRDVSVLEIENEIENVSELRNKLAGETEVNNRHIPGKNGITVEIDVSSINFNKNQEDGAIEINGKIQVSEDDGKIYKLFQFYNVEPPEEEISGEENKQTDIGVVIKSQLGEIETSIPREVLSKYNIELDIPDNGAAFEKTYSISDLIDFESETDENKIIHKAESIIKENNPVINNDNESYNEIKLIEKIKNDFPELKIKSIKLTKIENVESVRIELIPEIANSDVNQEEESISLKIDLIKDEVEPKNEVISQEKEIDGNYKFEDKGRLIIKSDKYFEISNHRNPDKIESEKLIGQNEELIIEEGSYKSEKSVPPDKKSDIAGIDSSGSENEKTKLINLSNEEIEIEVKVKQNTLIEHTEKTVNEFKSVNYHVMEKEKVFNKIAVMEDAAISEKTGFETVPVNEEMKPADMKMESGRKVEIKIIDDAAVDMENTASVSEKEVIEKKLADIGKENSPKETYVPAEVILQDEEENNLKLKGYLVVEKSEQKKPVKLESTSETGELTGLKATSEKVINMTGPSDKTNGDTKDFLSREHFGSKRDENKHDGVNAVEQKNFTKIIDQKIDEPQAQKAEIDYSKTIESIVKQVKLQFSRGVNEINIELEPKFLGKMKMKIRMEENHVTARVNVETAEVKRIIETNLDKLRDSLHDSGVEIEKFDVHVKQESHREFFDGDLNAKNNGRSFLKNSFNNVKPEIPVEVVKQVRHFGYNSMEITI